MKLSTDQLRSLPAFFQQITDHRRAQGHSHPIGSVLAIAAAAVLCGMRGYKAIANWTQALSPQARARFRCCYRKGQYIVPSESILRDVLIRVDPVELDQALQQWNARYGSLDESLAIDGKTITADTLLTQRSVVHYLVEQRKARYHFTVKGNQQQLRGYCLLV